MTSKLAYARQNHTKSFTLQHFLQLFFFPILSFSKLLFYFCVTNIQQLLIQMRERKSLSLSLSRTYLYGILHAYAEKNSALNQRSRLVYLVESIPILYLCMANEWGKIQPAMEANERVLVQGARGHFYIHIHMCVYLNMSGVYPYVPTRASNKKTHTHIHSSQKSSICLINVSEKRT